MTDTGMAEAGMTDGTDNPFGRVITAMVTPMNEDGSLDLVGLRLLAVHLADHGHDGLLVNGTTGESATTTDEEDFASVEAVVEAVGDRVKVMAGCGTNDTEHSMYAAREMAARGADSLLVVTPYYNKPTQDGIVEHFRMIAEAGGRPVMAYDIPGRTGTALTTDTIRRLAGVDGVRAVKDAKGDLFEASRLMAETDLLWYSGDDVLNLPHLAQGATGIVSVVVGFVPFLGLIVPNLTSLILGDDTRANLPWVALTGTVFLLSCDLVGRTVIAPLEIPASVILGVVGAVVFIALILRQRKVLVA